jgi:hypothetical protein
MSREEITRREKIRPVEIVAYIVLAWLAFAWFYSMRSLSVAKFWAMAAIPIPFILVIAIAVLLGRLNPKLRANPTALLIICFIMAMLTGKEYWFSHVHGGQIIDCTLPGGFNNYMVLMVWPTGVGESLARYMPDWLIPKDMEAVTYYFTGGGVTKWDVFTGPIISWSLIYISYGIFTFTLMFLLIGPYFARVERLTFPMELPYSFTVRETITGDQWGALFSFKKTEYKVFWVSVVIGLIINAPYVIGQILPIIPPAIMGGGFGTWPFNVTQIFPALSTLLPGAILNVFIEVSYIFLTVLMPMHFILTMLVVRVIMTILLPTIAIRAGLAPPGISTGWQWPLPFFYFVEPGMEIGLGIIILWRILRNFKPFYEEALKTHGISIKLGLAILIVFGAIFLGIFVAAGAPFPVLLIWFIINMLTSIGGAKMFAEYTAQLGCCYTPSHNTMLFPVGVAFGYWSATPPNIGNPAIVISTMLPAMSACIGPFQGNSVISMPQHANTYGAAYLTNVDMRKVFYILMAILITIFPFAFVYDVWFNTHVGIRNVGVGSMATFVINSAAIQINSGVQAAAFPLTPEQMWGTVIGGAIFALLLEFMRAKFAWFTISTVAVAFGMGPHASWWIGWPSLLIALGIKYLLNRLLGPKRAFELTVPIITGIMVGFVIGYIIVAALVMVTVSIPNMYALWK